LLTFFFTMAKNILLALDAVENWTTSSAEVQVNQVSFPYRFYIRDGNWPAMTACQKLLEKN
jgi:hypothetical protein